MEKYLKATVCAALTAAFVTVGALAAPDRLIPMGDVTGISVAARGAVVIGVEPIETAGGQTSPAGDAGLLPGDVIVRVASCDIESAADVEKATVGVGGESVTVTVERGGERKQLRVVTHKAEDGSGELGVWLRDTLTGIGTITFYDPDSGVFGALGHPVSDVDTGVALPMREGVIMRAAVTGVVAGKSGTPGQLCGELDFSHATGRLDSNTTVGVYGKSDELAATGREALPVAGEAEIKLGEVVVLSAALGAVEEYSAEITRVYTGGDARDMMVRITDERLLSTTGGIVQGMSGSPIIQNGKLIGAVTHVLINDPSRGYGVSIEDMIEASGLAA